MLQRQYHRGVHQYEAQGDHSFAHYEKTGSREKAGITHLSLTISHNTHLQVKFLLERPDTHTKGRLQGGRNDTIHIVDVQDIKLLQPALRSSRQGRMGDIHTHIREHNPQSYHLHTVNTLTAHDQTNDTLIKINRIRSHHKTRQGHNACLEAAEGLGTENYTNTNKPDNDKPQTKWFAYFIDEYRGLNPIFEVEHKNRSYQCILDTGAGVNLIGADTVKIMIPTFGNIMKTTMTQAKDVNGKKVHLIGKINLTLNFGGTTHTNIPFEISKEGTTMILGNPFLYKNDITIKTRQGFGNATPNQPSRTPKPTNLKMVTTTDTHIDKDGLSTIEVKTTLPRRSWLEHINKPFLICDEEFEDGTQTISTISNLTAEGTLMAIIHNISGSTDITIPEGKIIGNATTDFTDGESTVSHIMADLTDIAQSERNIHRIPTTDIIGENNDMENKDTEIIPPGFEMNGPHQGGIQTNLQQSPFDIERENKGDTIETAIIHAPTEAGKTKIRNLLRKHQQIFSRYNYDIGHFMIDGVIQKIKLTLSDTSPIVEKYRTISPTKRQAAIDILDELEKAKIITKKASGFASQAVWVSKALPELTPTRAKELNIPYIPGEKDPEGKRNLRFCQDYRQLNSRLQQVQWPLPSVKNVLGRLKDIKYVTVLDASHSFFCIELDEESKIYTGFQACERNFVMNRLAMGLKCSSGVLNACLAKTLQGLEAITIPYSDNILIISKTETDHIKHIDLVLEALGNHGWKFKLVKSHFCVNQSLKIFGMMVNLQKGTIKPDPVKTKTLKETPRPSTKKQLRSFLGGIGYFIECLPDVGRPMSILQDMTKTTNPKKKETLIWDDNTGKAFKDIITTLNNHNDIYMPDWHRPFHLVVDAGPSHTSAMLVQIADNNKWIPLGFFNKKLTIREQKLSQVEREALAVVYGLRQSSYYVAHSKTFIHSDNKPFVMLKKYSTINTKLARWKLWIDSFDHELVWESSTSPAISFADFLSRPPSTKLKNKTITREDIENMPKQIPDGIYTPTQYNKILDEIISKENQQNNKEVEICLATAASTTTPGSRGRPPTRDQETFTIAIGNITSNQHRLQMGLPSRTSAIGKTPGTPEESLIEVFAAECPYVNLNTLRDLQKHCSKLGKIYNNIDSYPDYILHDRLLLRKFSHGEINRLLMAVPVCLADDLISEIHKGTTSTHPGKDKLRQMIRTRYFIPDLHKRISKIVENCGICAFYKSKTNTGPRPDAKTMKATGPGDLWAMDHIQITSRPDGQDRSSLLCFVDAYSHFLICRAVPKNITARFAAQIFLEDIISRFGVPRALLSDNGPDMDNVLWRETANLLNIRKITISAGNPRSNGICEKVQGLILASIRFQAAQYRIKPENWTDLAIWAALAHNSSPFQKLNPPLSPAEIFLGRPISESTFFGFANAAYSYNSLEEFNRKMVAAQHTISEIINMRDRYLDEIKDKTGILQSKTWDFPPGTLVGLKEKSQATRDANIKLRPRYRGVFIVMKQSISSCHIRPYSSETILADMENENEAFRGRGRALPR